MSSFSACLYLVLIFVSPFFLEILTVGVVCCSTLHWCSLISRRGKYLSLFDIFRKLEEKRSGRGKSICGDLQRDEMRPRTYTSLYFYYALSSSYFLNHSPRAAAAVVTDELDKLHRSLTVFFSSSSSASDEDVTQVLVFDQPPTYHKARKRSKEEEEEKKE